MRVNGGDRGVEQGKILSFLATEFTTNLIFGHALGMKEIWEHARLLGFDSIPDVVMVANIDNFVALGEQRSERWRQNLKRQVLETCRRGLAEYQAIACLIEGDNMVVLLNTRFGRGDPGEFARRVGEILRVKVSEEVQHSITVGVSRPHHDPFDLTIAYVEATRAQRHKFMLGKNRVIHVDEVPPTLRDAVMLTGEEEAELQSGIREGNRTRVRAAIESHFARLAAGQATSELARLRVLELNTLFTRVGLEAGASTKILAELGLSLLGRVSKCEVLSDLSALAIEMAGEYLDAVSAIRATSGDRAVALARDYIGRNYHLALTVPKVASVVHISPFYFCRMFKRETGHTFGQYLLAERIKQAQQLMANSNLTIEQVARRVGYRKAGHFSRKFREFTGVSPAEFKRASRDSAAISALISAAT